MSVYCAALGKRLEELRRGRSLSITDVEAAIGISYSSVSRFEAGLRRPSLTAFVRMVEFYGASPWAILLQVASETWPSDEAPPPPDRREALLWAALCFDAGRPAPRR